MHINMVVIVINLKKKILLTPLRMKSILRSPLRCLTINTALSRSALAGEDSPRVSMWKWKVNQHFSKKKRHFTFDSTFSNHLKNKLSSRWDQKTIPPLFSSSESMFMNYETENKHQDSFDLKCCHEQRKWRASGEDSGSDYSPWAKE